MQAKDTLKRIETRDLYHCSGKVRIPKTSQGSLPDNEHQPQNDEDASKNEDRGNKLWRALMAMSKQPEAEAIRQFLTPEKQQTIEKKDLWVPVSVCMCALHNNYCMIAAIVTF